jgi:hypothetical protein
MIYSKDEMRDMLMDYFDMDEDTMDILVTILGDSVQTYKHILTAGTGFKTFEELENSSFSDEYV